jgi:hypothetical protein
MEDSEILNAMDTCHHSAQSIKFMDLASFAR